MVIIQKMTHQENKKKWMSCIIINTEKVSRANLKGQIKNRSLLPGFQPLDPHGNSAYTNYSELLLIYFLICNYDIDFIYKIWFNMEPMNVTFKCIQKTW